MDDFFQLGRASAIFLVLLFPAALVGQTVEASSPPEAKAPAEAASSAAQNESLGGDILSGLVIIEGDAGRGSGFLAKLNGQYFVVTNLHVLSGQSRFTVTGADGTKIRPTGEIFAAHDADIALLKIPPPEHPLEILDNALLNTKAQDLVTVPGNSDGAGVVTQSNGRLLGIGPQLVEVDAKFVHGNSGSPIIHRPTGKVIGIATYATTYKLDDLKKAANLRTVRWFGYRLDNIKQWDKLDWAKFSAEGKKIASIEQMTDSLISVLTNTKTSGEISPTLKDAVLLFVKNMQKAEAQKNTREQIAAAQNFADQLQYLSSSDLKSVNPSGLYPYHAKIYQQQKELRADIGDAMRDQQRLLNALSR